MIYSGVTKFKKRWVKQLGEVLDRTALFLCIALPREGMICGISELLNAVWKKLLWAGNKFK